MGQAPGVSYRAFLAQMIHEDVLLAGDETSQEAGENRVTCVETCIARLLEPILAALSPPALRAIEYAAFLPPDNIPFPWLRDLLLDDFPELNRAAETREAEGLRSRMAQPGPSETSEPAASRSKQSPRFSS